MSGNTIHNSNNKVVQNKSNKIFNTSERQGSTSNSTLNNELQHQHFMNLPIPSLNPSFTNINILQQLNLPPLPPPAAFQPIQSPQQQQQSIPGMSTIPTIPTIPAMPVFQPVTPLAPKLNPSAPAFTPNPAATIPFPNATNSVQGSMPNPKQQGLAQQIEAINQKIQESLTKLQLLSLQLNTLNMINQQNQTLQSLQQYQSVYQQYQLEIGNTLLLNQYLQNLNNQQIAQQQIEINNQNVVTPGLQLNDESNKKATIGQLETIEEGEEEELETDNVAAPDNNNNNNNNEGTEDMKDDTVETTQTETVGEQFEEKTDTDNLWKFQKPEKNTADVGERVDGHNKVSELEKIKKQIRGILNKITPENFDKLSQDIASILKVADIAVRTEAFQGFTEEQYKVAIKAQFKALIKLILKCILEKAIKEPLFSNQYARLCYSLYLYAEQNELKKKLFRQQLLSLCHSVFKKARASAESQRFIGIITMIGELFTYGLVSWNVINSGVFEELLPPTQALDIEAVCKLLKTSGHDLDKHHYKEINGVIDNLAKYAQNYDFRTQCLVKDIYEMRQNDWKQRKDQKKEEPKTLNEIHKDFHIEHQTKKEPAMKYKKVNNYQPQSTYRPVQTARNDYPSYRPRYNSYDNAPNTRGYYHQNRNNNRWRHNGNYMNNNKYNNNNNYNRYNQNPRRKPKNLRPTVEFVKDVTLPDRSHYPANKVLTKTWAMRNSGELPWGGNVELVYFKGDESLSLEKRYPVIDAQPGQQVEISASIRTPSEPGRYCTYFRLQKNGKFFGPRVWVDIIVSGQPGQAMDNRSNCATRQEAQAHNNKKKMVPCQ